MNVSNRQVVTRSHSTPPASDMEPAGTDHTSTYDRTPNGVERSSLWDKQWWSAGKLANLRLRRNRNDPPGSELANGRPFTAAHQVSHQRVGHGVPRTTHKQDQGHIESLHLWTFSVRRIVFQGTNINVTLSPEQHLEEKSAGKCSRLLSSSDRGSHPRRKTPSGPKETPPASVRNRDAEQNIFGILTFFVFYLYNAVKLSLSPQTDYKYETFDSDYGIWCVFNENKSVKDKK